MDINFEKELNKEQYLAVTSKAKYLRIIAGAGTGKTRTLTFRLANLILRGDVIPSHIVAITFTNKAANEMKQRTKTLLAEKGIMVSSFPLIMTFHAFCLKFLRRELVNFYPVFNKNFSIISESDLKVLEKQVAEKIGYKISDNQFKEIMNMIHHLKTKGIKVSDVVIDSKDPLINTKNQMLKAYNFYQESLVKQNLLDFDDILIYTKEILAKFDYIREKYSSYYSVFMIDEFQDTNDLQYEIVKYFMNNDSELCVVGDPDQTIYTWRGANNSLIKSRLQHDFSSLETVVLDLNYRSTQQILDVANKVISHNNDRDKKTLVSFNNKVGENVKLINAYSQKDEADEIANTIKLLHVNDDVEYSKIAIIYRSNFLSSTFEALRNYRIPYKLYGTISFYEREEIKTSLAYLKVLYNPADEFSFLRIISTPKKKIGEKTYLNIKSQVSEENLVLDICNNFDNLNISDTIKSNLKPFADAYKYMLENIEKENSVEQTVNLVRQYFENVGLFKYYEDVDKLENDDTNLRVDNINQLLNDIKSFLENAIMEKDEDKEATLLSFLLSTSLLSDQDELDEEEHVSIMTGHIAKGLEFDYVFVSGLVNGIFPSNHALNDTSPSKMEEERRLCYVMFTRAKKRLYVSTFGGTSYSGEMNLPSMFLKEADINAKIMTHNKFSEIDGLYESINKDNIPFVASSNYKPKYDSKNNVNKLTDVNISNEKEVYNIGDKVNHISFGIGVVTKVENKYLYVKFPEPYNEKKLMLGFKAYKKVK